MMKKVNKSALMRDNSAWIMKRLDSGVRVVDITKEFNAEIRPSGVEFISRESMNQFIRCHAAAERKAERASKSLLNISWNKEALTSAIPC